MNPPSVARGNPYTRSARAACDKTAYAGGTATTPVAIAFPRSPMIVANQTWDLHKHSMGRFVLGLGSQVKAHNERRFSTPWIAPAARMGEDVEALQAIFRCWGH